MKIWRIGNYTSSKMRKQTVVKKPRFLKKRVSLLYNQLSTKVRVQKAQGRQKFNPAIFNLPEAISVKINAIRLFNSADLSGGGGGGAIERLFSGCS